MFKLKWKIIQCKIVVKILENDYLFQLMSFTKQKFVLPYLWQLYNSKILQYFFVTLRKVLVKISYGKQFF